MKGAGDGSCTTVSLQPPTTQVPMGLFTYDMDISHIPEPLALGHDREEDLEEEEQLDALWQVWTDGGVLCGGKVQSVVKSARSTPLFPNMLRSMKMSGLRTRT